MISSFDRVAMLPLKGRDVQFETQKSSRRAKSQFESIETPPMPFEKDMIKKKMPKQSSKSSLRGSLIDRTPKNADGVYAIRFKDSTWKSTAMDNYDQPPTPEYIQGLITNYKKNIDIKGYKGADLANHKQAVNDLMLEELINQLRVINLGQAELLEIFRQANAEVYSLLLEDAQASRKEIIKLKQETHQAHLDKNNTINQCNLRIQAMEDDTNKKITEMHEELEKKKEEYDHDMKDFLDQKSKLEEHVKALHHVFLDFQSDAVYLKLEELKQETERCHQKLAEKDEDITRLQMSIQKWKNQQDELLTKQKSLEDANMTLREQIHQIQLHNAQLLRQIELLKADLDDDGLSAEELAELRNQHMLDEVNSLMTDKKQENNHTPIAMKRVRKNTLTEQYNPQPYINLYQKLSKLSLLISRYIENTSGQMLSLSDKNDDANELKLVSGSSTVALQALSNKIDDVYNVADCLNNISSGNNVVFHQTGPRFVQFFSSGIAGKPAMKTDSKGNIYWLIRRIFQAKLMSDKWALRSGRKVTPFPDFVLNFFYEEDGRMSFALHHCKELWENLQKEKSPECKLFLRFLTEDLVEDELSFFLAMRSRLIGIPILKEEEPEVVKIQFTKCVELLDSTVGTLSPVKTGVMKKAEKLNEKGFVDYASFLACFVEFYREQRQQRREAVKIMVTSKKYNGDIETPIFIELFVSMMQALNFTGSMEELLEFYRYAQILGGGDINVDSVLRAMDQLSIHFFSIDIPLDRDHSFDQGEMARQMVMEHWLKFGQWFEGLRKSNRMEPWVKRLLVAQVRKTEQAFQLSLPGTSLYFELRELYDKFQYILNTLTRGTQNQVDKDVSERQLKLFEDLNSLLLDVVVDSRMA